MIPVYWFALEHGLIADSTSLLLVNPQFTLLFMCICFNVLINRRLKLIKPLVELNFFMKKKAGF